MILKIHAFKYAGVDYELRLELVTVAGIDKGHTVMKAFKDSPLVELTDTEFDALPEADFKKEFLELLDVH